MGSPSPTALSRNPGLLGKQVEQLEAWFTDYVRPFLDSYAPGSTKPLASEFARLGALLAAPSEVVVCLLGSAGIGKSTLINALVADDQQVLPSGGIGPLTAQATSVRYAETPYFRAQYYKAGHLQKLIFPIQQHLARAKAGSAVTLTPEAIQSELGSDVDEDAVSELLADATDTDERQEGRYGELVKRARMLVKGDQFAMAEEEYLLDRLWDMVGRPAKNGTTATDADAARVESVKRALALASSETPLIRNASDDRAGFRKDLENHTAGHLAPLLKEIEVGWPAALLQGGLVIVDLPGIGTAGDAHRLVTQRFIREQARAVVAVVDRAGMTEASMDLLRKSGYWDRVVSGAYEPSADPCTLLVAVTRVDDVVDEEFGKYKDLPREDRPRRRDLFANKVAEMKERIHHQTADQLSQLEVTAGAADSEALAQARATAKTIILDGLAVFPVSAPEYRRVRGDDPDDKPRIVQDAEETQVPILARALSDLASEVRSRREGSIDATVQRLERGIRDELAIVRSQWEGEERAAEEAEQLRKELEAEMVPLQQEQANRQGAFREFLQGQEHQGIPALVTEAKSAAEKDIRAYLRGLQDFHWATLRAAVRRGGCWQGSRHIDLPNDIAARFQEPVAGVWGVKLLRAVRQRTKDYADATVTHVGKVCDMARGRGASVQVALLEAQEQRIADKADQLRDVGREATDELRSTVKNELFKVIDKPIQKQCDAFVTRGDHIGRGVKQRILDLFNSLAEEAAQAAEAPSRRILTRRFNEVRQSVEEAFAQWKDPLREAVDAIAQTHEDRTRRADAKKRREVTAAIKSIWAASPIGDRGAA